MSQIVSFCKDIGLIYQSSEIYGGFEGFFDYGPIGALIKNNIHQVLIKELITKRSDIFLLNTSIICHPQVWKSSGHVDKFSDNVLITEKSFQKTRADHFVAEQLNINTEGKTAEELFHLIKENNLSFNGEKIEKVVDLNTMFKTTVGDNIQQPVYLRPETCQSIFTNFQNVVNTNRVKLPFGLFQIGKAFRNEIAPRNFIFRCREFEQAELEYFFDPSDSILHFDLNDAIFSEPIPFWSADDQLNQREPFLISYSELVKLFPKIHQYHAFWIFFYFRLLTKVFEINPGDLRIREHQKDELSHYSQSTVDFEFKYPFGFKELMGIANRGNYDLNQHQKFANRSHHCQFNINNLNVIEPSIGIDRLFYAILVQSLRIDSKATKFLVPFQLAPYSVAVFPLKDNNHQLVEKSKKIHQSFVKDEISCSIDINGFIGKKYARQDEIGTPFCLTIDFSTLKDDTITIRYRNDGQQKRIPSQKATKIVRKLLNQKIQWNDISL